MLASPFIPPVLLSAVMLIHVAMCRSTLKWMRLPNMVWTPILPRHYRHLGLDCFKLHCLQDVLPVSARQTSRSTAAQLLELLFSLPRRACKFIVFLDLPDPTGRRGFRSSTENVFTASHTLKGDAPYHCFRQYEYESCSCCQVQYHPLATNAWSTPCSDTIPSTASFYLLANLPCIPQRNRSRLFSPEPAYRRTDTRQILGMGQILVSSSVRFALPCFRPASFFSVRTCQFPREMGLMVCGPLRLQPH